VTLVLEPTTIRTMLTKNGSPRTLVGSPHKPETKDEKNKKEIRRPPKLEERTQRDQTTLISFQKTK
jgi:hypothetical protein